MDMKKIKATPIVMLLVKDVNLLEHDPEAQYKFNRFMMLFFLWQMPGVLIILLLFHKLWLAVGLIYLTEISIWSLVEGHLGNMTSAIAAINTSKKAKTAQLAESHQPTTSYEPFPDIV